jgi:hypothetical protein
VLVVQKKSIKGARRLLVNNTEQGQPSGPVTVMVADRGHYQATVFPTREAVGILDSNVAYSMEIEVGVVDAPTEESISDTAGSPSGNFFATRIVLYIRNNQEIPGKIGTKSSVKSPGKSPI